MTTHRCKFCNSELEHVFCDLGMQPLCEEFVKAENINKPQSFYHLGVLVCKKCFLVQIDNFISPETIYKDYLYYSSYSDWWLEHAKKYCNEMMIRYQLGKESFVAEIASNDGYLLKNFRDKNIRHLGIDPSVEVAEYANSIGVKTENIFFNSETAVTLADKYGKPDLLIGNNVLAHVPEINDFIKGMKLFLAPGGVITMEFPHLLQLIMHSEFDTIYHEHFYYYSLLAVSNMFSHFGLRIFDVQELSSHGGSLRIFACHNDNKMIQQEKSVEDLLKVEKTYGLDNVKTYTDFQEKVNTLKRNLLQQLINLKENGKSIAGYGAPGKGNILLNFCGIKTDLLDFTVDRNEKKHGYVLPGTLIPILNPDKIKELKPDYVLILPWNLKDEIIKQISFIREWGGKFIIPVPKVEILP